MAVAGAALDEPPPDEFTHGGRTVWVSRMSVSRRAPVPGPALDAAAEAEMLCHDDGECGGGGGAPLAGPALDAAATAGMFCCRGGGDITGGGGDIAPLAVPGGEGPSESTGTDLGVHGRRAASTLDGEGVAVRLPFEAFHCAAGVGAPIPAAPAAVPGVPSSGHTAPSSNWCTAATFGFQLTDRFRFPSEPELCLMFTPVIHLS